MRQDHVPILIKEYISLPGCARHYSIALLSISQTVAQFLLLFHVVCLPLAKLRIQSVIRFEALFPQVISSAPLSSASSLR